MNSGSVCKLVWTSESMSGPTVDRNVSKSICVLPSQLDSPDCVEVVIIELRYIERTQYYALHQRFSFN